MKIAVIGMGAAGLMCASLIDKEKCEVSLYEKMPRSGVKLSITGKGRCNVTTATEPGEMAKFINHGGKFLRSALFSFTPSDTRNFFESRGVELKTERGGRVFPASDKASDIVACLESEAKSGAKVIREKVRSIEKRADGFVVSSQSGDLYYDKIVIATGGMSYPKTGSTGDGYKFAAKFGHKITPISPSLVPLTVREDYAAKMQGLSLKNIGITVLDKNGRKIYDDFGEMLFTHFGCSGPVILSASSHLDFESNSEYKLKIDLKPALDRKTLDKRILRDFEEQKNRDFINAISKLLPSKMIPVAAEYSGISPQKKVNSITKAEREKFLDFLKEFSLTVTGKRPIDEAIITSGGIDVSEIDPRTMESKITKGLFFAGEVMDVDALTGGYNLQIAFSTAYLAANGITKEQ